MSRVQALRKSFGDHAACKVAASADVQNAQNIQCCRLAVLPHKLYMCLQRVRSLPCLVLWM